MYHCSDRAAVPRHQPPCEASPHTQGDPHLGHLTAVLFQRQEHAWAVLVEMKWVVVTREKGKHNEGR